VLYKFFNLNLLKIKLSYKFLKQFLCKKNVYNFIELILKKVLLLFGFLYLYKIIYLFMKVDLNFLTDLFL
jgi:hypothetical protein